MGYLPEIVYLVISHDKRKPTYYNSRRSSSRLYLHKSGAASYAKHAYEFEVWILKPGEDWVEVTEDFLHY